MKEDPITEAINLLDEVIRSLMPVKESRITWTENDITYTLGVGKTGTWRAFASFSVEGGESGRYAPLTDCRLFVRTAALQKVPQLIKLIEQDKDEVLPKARAAAKEAIVWLKRFKEQNL